MSIDYTKRAMVLPGISRQYVTGRNLFTNMQPSYLPDDEYAKALDTFVIVCVDIVIIDPNGQIVLGKRQQEPHSDWWIIGGRMRAGETFETTASRSVLREVGIDIAPSSFKLVNFYNQIWDTKAQGEGGCHTLSVTLQCRITDEQVGMIRLNQEYADMKWISPNEILSANVSEYHPILRQMMRDYVNVEQS